MSMLFITHDLGVVAEIADEVVVMYLGRVVEHGTVDEIFHNPQHPYTRALLDSIPRMRRAAPGSGCGDPRPGAAPAEPAAPAARSIRAVISAIAGAVRRRSDPPHLSTPAPTPGPLCPATIRTWSR